MKNKRRLRNLGREWIETAMSIHAKLSKEKGEKRESYLNHVQNLMIDFQLIESGLKIYLQMTLLKVHSLLLLKIPFNYDMKKINDMSFRQVSDFFKRFNDNQTLQRKIKNVIPERNHFAHRGYLLFFGTKNEIIKEIRWLDNNLTRCTNLYPKLEAILEGIKKEIEKVKKIKV